MHRRLELTAGNPVKRTKKLRQSEIRNPKSEIVALWLRTARRHGEHPAVIDASSGHVTTFRELHTRTVALASQWPHSITGQVVAFVLPNCVEWIARFLALQSVGAAALPLDASLPSTAHRATAARMGAHWLWSDRKIIRLDARHKIRTSACCIKTTSGSTGDYKMVACHPCHLIADGRQIIRTMGIRPGDRNLALIPLGHSYGLGNLVMPLILQGTPLVLAPAFVPHQIAEWTRRFHATVFPSVPAIFRVLAETPSIRRLSPLRLAISAGATLSPQIAVAFHRRFGIKIHNFYGSSETGGICYDRTGNAAMKGGGVGRALDGVKVRCGLDGRIEVRSRAVVDGQGAGTSGRHILPDLGELDRQGGLRLVGRIGSVANIGGKKVHPSEIESALRAMKGVADAWVTVKQDARGRDYLASAVETKRSRQEIEKTLGACLPTWKLPRQYLVIPRLPRTIRGKLDVTEVRAMLEAQVAFWT